MKHTLAPWRILATCGWLAACGSVATPTSAPLSAPDPTAAPSTPSGAVQAVTFETPDGATIPAQLYGSGDTAIVFSVMGDCRQGWTDFARTAADQGFRALTFEWRGCHTDPNNESLLKRFLDDTRGAIDYVRGQGASSIILVGASLGGVASARLAAESQASALVAVSSPDRIEPWGVQVERADVGGSIPKLFVASDDDPVVPASATRALHDLAAEPRQWLTYPGRAHGIELFAGESGPEFEQALLTFLLEVRGARSTSRAVELILGPFSSSSADHRD